jgi:disulfide bond formation protein DsbB
MLEYILTLNYLFAVIVVFVDLVLMLLVVSRLTTGMWLPPRFDVVFLKHVPLLLLLVSSSAVLLSLFYSEVVGLPVCALCWFARTMMLPIAVLSIVSYVRKDPHVWVYILSLALIGMCITLYHHLYQIGVVAGSLCTALADGGDCAKRYVYEFGFVTMPWMGFTIFALLAFLSWRLREAVKR